MVQVIVLEEMKGFIIVLMTKCDPHLLCRHMPWKSYEVLGFSTVSTNSLWPRVVLLFPYGFREKVVISLLSATDLVPASRAPTTLRPGCGSAFPAGQRRQPAQKVGLARRAGAVQGKHTQPVLSGLYWLPISFREGDLTINSCRSVLCSHIF